MTKSDDVLIECLRFSLERLRQYRHQADMRGDATQSAQIQKDREHITHSLECGDLLGKLFDTKVVQL